LYDHDFEDALRRGVTPTSARKQAPTCQLGATDSKTTTIVSSHNASLEESGNGSAKNFIFWTVVAVVALTVGIVYHRTVGAWVYTWEQRQKAPWREYLLKMETLKRNGR